MSVGRIERPHVVVSLTVKRNIGIGHYNCDECGTETPRPPREAMVKVAQQGENFIWPVEHWMPKGWSTIGNGDAQRMLCSDCTGAIKKALSARRRKG